MFFYVLEARGKLALLESLYPGSADIHYRTTSFAKERYSPREAYVLARDDFKKLVGIYYRYSR